MLCEHGNTMPCVECYIDAEFAEKAALRTRLAELEEKSKLAIEAVNYHDRLVEAVQNMVKPGGGTAADVKNALDILEELGKLP